MNLMSLTAVELGKKIKSGEVTAVEATKAALEQIKKLDGTYNCYVTVDEEAALKEAEEVQKKIEAGELTAGSWQRPAWRGAFPPLGASPAKYPA